MAYIFIRACQNAAAAGMPKIVLQSPVPVEMCKICAELQCKYVQ